MANGHRLRHEKLSKYKLLTASYEQEPEQILNITPTFSGEQLNFL